MKRFFYSAIRGMDECEGIVRAESIDRAREKLIQEGYEEITLGVLSSCDVDLDDATDQA